LFVTLEIAPDRRRIEAEPDEDAHARAVEWARRFVEAQVGLAREMSRIDGTKTYVAYDCASIEEYGVRLGLSVRDARQLVDLGHALDLAATPELAARVARAEEGATEGRAPVASPTVADVILAGVLSAERGAAAGRLAAAPELLRAGEDPVALATAGSMRDVRATLRTREEEHRQREELVTVAFAVTVRARDGFCRARSIASERAGTMLTEGETFSVVVGSYLDTHDAVRTGEGRRRLPDTSELPGSRYIPAEVRRAVRRRSGDRCEVPGCPRRTFLEFAHVERHCKGGSREERNLVHECDVHHVLMDAGRIRVVGWTDEGRPRFVDHHGRPIEEGPSFAASASWAGGDPEYPEDEFPDDEDDDEVRGDGRRLSGPEAGQVAERPPPYGEAAA
jgi:hypothetical protein